MLSVVYQLLDTRCAVFPLAVQGSPSFASMGPFLLCPFRVQVSSIVACRSLCGVRPYPLPCGHCQDQQADMRLPTLALLWARWQPVTSLALPLASFLSFLPRSATDNPDKPSS